jgi:hypothetical protein
LRRTRFLLAAVAVATLSGCAPYVISVDTGTTGVVGVAATDVDGDGVSDVVAVSRNGTLAVLEFSHQGFRTLRTLSLPAGSAPSDVVAGKFGTGNEVVIAERGRDALAVYSSLRAGATPQELTLGPGAQPRSLAAGDLNQDGYNDLAVSVVVPTLFGCAVSGCVDIYYGSATGLVYSGQSLPLGDVDGGYDPRWITLDRWDGDANLDLIAADHGTGTASIWRGDGRGGLSLVRRVSAPNAVTPAVLAGASALFVGTDSALKQFTGDSTTGLDGLKGRGSTAAMALIEGARIVVTQPDGTVLVTAPGLETDDPARPKAPGATRVERLTLRAGGGDVTAGVVVNPTTSKLQISLAAVLWTGPAEVNFGKVTVGKTGKATLKVGIAGPELKITRAFNGPFGTTLAANDYGQGCLNKLNGGSLTCVTPLTFTPPSVGKFTGTIKLFNNGDGDIPFVQQPLIKLVGEGVAPAPPAHGKTKAKAKTKTKRPTTKKKKKPPAPSPSAAPSQFGSTRRVTAAPADAQPLAFGVTEDAGKFDDDGGRSIGATLADLGMTEQRWSLPWDPDHPTQITQLGILERSGPVAGNGVILSLYSANARRWDTAAFCAWAHDVAAQVKGWGISRFIVGNEPNTAVFWSPPDPVGYERLLETCYATIHAANPAAQVIGLALSPRATGSGVAPLGFIKRVAAAYTAGPQSHPLMDAVSIHPYPNPNRADDAPSVGYPPTQDAYGIPNLDRVKQALYDGFHGTVQPWELPLVIDEIGWQVDTSGDARYSGKENVRTVSATQQAGFLHDALTRYLMCDPWVSDVLLFHLIDETTRAFDAASGTAGWQSGLEYADRTPRQPTYDSVKADAARGRAGCTGGYAVWTPRR